jgi:uncharacterized membrane protein
MSQEKFSRTEAIRFGWETMKRNLWFFVAILILTWLIPGVFNIMAQLTKKNFGFLSFIFSIIGLMLSLFLGMGMLKISLKFCDKEKAKVSDLFSCAPMFFKYLFGSFLSVLIIFGGLILLIIPGIIWAIKFSFFGYFIIDKKLGPIESLKKSSLITQGSKWNLFRFGLLTIGVMFLGALALLVGLFAAIPTVMVAQAFVYRKLLSYIETVQVAAV